MAKRLLEKEMLNIVDMVELLGPRPFQEKSSYEEFGEELHFEEENLLPEGPKEGQRSEENNKQSKSALYL